MSSVKISQLTASSGLSSADLIPVVDNTDSQTQKATFQQVLNYITGSTFNTLSVTTANITSITGTLIGSVVGTSSYSENSNLLDGLNSTDFARLSENNTFTGITTFTNEITGTTAYFSSNVYINGTASIGFLNTVSQSSLLIGDKYITILSGGTDHVSLDGSGILWGSGGVGPTVNELGANAHLRYRNSLDSLEVFPGLYVSGSTSISGNLTVTGSTDIAQISGTIAEFTTITGSTVTGSTATFTTVSASVISASQYVGLTAGNVTGTGTSSRLAYWLGTNNIGEVSEISYISPSPGNGSRINYHNSGQGITFDMSTNTANSSIFLVGAGAGSVEIYQNASTYYGGASGINFSAPGPVIKGAMGLQIKTVDNPFVTSELTITHEVPSGLFTRTLMKTSYNSGVLINPNGNNDFNFRVNGNGGSALLLGDTSTNRIGINKTSPNAQLDVNGNTIISGNLTVTGTISASNYLGLPSASLDLTKLIVSSSVSLTTTQRAVFAKNNISSSISITLPSVSIADSKEYYIIKADSISGSVIISGSSPNLINGQSTFELNGPHQSVTLIHDGTDWYVF